MISNMNKAYNMISTKPINCAESWQNPCKGIVSQCLTVLSVNYVASNWQISSYVVSIIRWPLIQWLFTMKSISKGYLYSQIVFNTLV